jgi:cytidyltransferase-related domain
MKTVVVTGSFNNIKSQEVRFLQEAAKFGELTVFLWTDSLFEEFEGRKPQFPQEERLYFVESIRFVQQGILVNEVKSRDELPKNKGVKPDVWVVIEKEDSPEKRHFCEIHKIQYSIVKEKDLAGFPIVPFKEIYDSSHKKVIVTGSFDWLHTGHIRFFEETSELGDLFVVVGHDQNLLLLKGEGHPLFSENERLYMVQSIRFVKQALISTGHGWMDAEPEIEKIKPDIYVVNEDGDVPDKREFCRRHGLQYLVLKRTPKPGLKPRQSTSLRGF